MLSCAVVIPTYNRARFLRESIDSVLQQTRRPEQVIVVDDGSKDETRDILASYGARITALFKANGGKSSALNLALAEVRSDCVWIFDDDDVALPHALERHLAALEEDPSSDFTYSPHYFGRSDAAGRIEITGEAEVEEVAPDDFFPRVLLECPVNHPNIVVRTACYRAVGPFDESLVRSVDYEMLLRLSRRFRPVFVAERTYIYRSHDGPRGGGRNEFSSALMLRKWGDFNRQIFRGMFAGLAASEYLPRGAALDQRQAALRKAAIAFARWMPETAAAEVAAAVQLDAQAGIGPTEAEFLARAARSFTVVNEADWPGASRMAKVARGQLGAEICR